MSTSINSTSSSSTAYHNGVIESDELQKRLLQTIEKQAKRIQEYKRYYAKFKAVLTELGKTLEITDADKLSRADLFQKIFNRVDFYKRVNLELSRAWEDHAKTPVSSSTLITVGSVSAQIKELVRYQMELEDQRSLLQHSNENFAAEARYAEFQREKMAKLAAEKEREVMGLRTELTEKDAEIVRLKKALKAETIKQVFTYTPPSANRRPQVLAVIPS